MSAITLLNPYQLLGTPIPEGMSAADALTHTGLAGWNQRLVQPHVADGTVLFPSDDFRYNVADLPTGPTILGAVKRGYRPIQHEEAFLPIIGGMEAEGFKPLYAGAWENGKSAYIQFQVPTLRPIAGGEVQSTLVIVKRNDGQGAIHGYPAPNRVPCANMLRSIVRKATASVTVRHAHNADPHVLEQAVQFLGMARDAEDDVLATIAKMERTPVTRLRYHALIGQLLGDKPADSTRRANNWQRTFDGLAAAWDSPVAADGNSMWRAFNAVTEYEQHHRSENAEAMARAVVANEQPLTRRLLALAA